MASTSHIPLVPLLRRLLDLHIDQEAEDQRRQQELLDDPRKKLFAGVGEQELADIRASLREIENRRRTLWEVAIPILLNRFQVPGIDKGVIREHLVYLRFDGYDVPALAEKTGKEYLDAFRALPLGGVDRSTPLSVELARLDGEGFGRELVETLTITRGPEIATVLRDLQVLMSVTNQTSASKYENDCGRQKDGRASASGNKDNPQTNPLGALQHDILDALRVLKATDPEKRATGATIAQKVGGTATDQSVKAPLADLKHRGLVDSQTGRQGGSWLTSKGLEFINSLRPRK